MKRLLWVAVMAAAAASLTGCNVGPNAAVVGADTISASSFTGLLAGMQHNDAVQCAETISWLQTWVGTRAKAPTPAPVVDGVGDDTVSIGVADTMLRQVVQETVLRQALARRHLHVTAADRTRVTAELQQSLSLSNLTSANGQSVSEPPSCDAFGVPTPSATKLMTAWPKTYRDFQVDRVADQEVLGRDLVHVTAGQVQAYYQQNASQYQDITVNVIVSSSQQKAQQIANAINGGANFATEARANSLDQQSAARGGVLFSGPVAEFEQGYSSLVQVVSQLTPGKVGAPLEFQGSTQGSPPSWVIFETPGLRQSPLSEVAGAIATTIASEEISPAVSSYLAQLAKSEHIAIDRRYGSWTASDDAIAAPPTPSAQSVLNCGANLAPDNDASAPVSPSLSPTCRLAPGA